MTRDEKERLQYLLAQYLEGKATEGALESMLNGDPDELESVLVELMAAEPEPAGYDARQWEGVLQHILHTSSTLNIPEPVKPVDRQKNDPYPMMEPVLTSMSKRRTFFSSRWARAASVAAVILIVGMWWLISTGRQSTIATRYGQQKKIRLPDETEITLNAHSTIRYGKLGQTGQPREVWLEGEALFRVKHLNRDTASIKSGERFLVHTALAEIEVLGTVFNVRERRGRTTIVLQEGSIRVRFTREGRPAVVMQPGQMLTIGANEQTSTSPVKPEEYTAWTKNKLVLNNAAFGEIAAYMEDNFGKRIVLADPGLAGRKVEGTFQMDNLDDALLVLSKALNVEIEQRGDTLIFSNK